MRTDVLGRFGGGLEQAHQCGAGGGVLLGTDQGPADLAGNFPFAHDGGVKSGADGEKVLADRLPAAGVQGTGDGPLGQSAALADLPDDGGAGRLDVVGRAGLGIDFVAVAGGQGHRTQDLGVAIEHGGSDLGGAGTEAGNGLEVDIGMRSNKGN